MLILSERPNVISFFKHSGIYKLYVFNGSIASLQNFYRAPLKVSLLKSGVLCTLISEVDVVIKYGHVWGRLIKTEWGCELHL